MLLLTHAYCWKKLFRMGKWKKESSCMFFNKGPVQLGNDTKLLTYVPYQLCFWSVTGKGAKDSFVQIWTENNIGKEIGTITIYTDCISLSTETISVYMNWYILTKNHNNIIKKLSVFGKWGGKSRYCKQTNVRYKRVTEVHFLPWKNNQNVNQTAMQRRNGGAAWVGAFNHIQTLTWLGCQTPLWRRILDNQILRIFPHIRYFFADF